VGVGPHAIKKMTRTYLQVIVLEALVITVLWIFGRLFA
jgi:hypothetical protein